MPVVLCVLGGELRRGEEFLLKQLLLGVWWDITFLGLPGSFSCLASFGGDINYLLETEYTLNE